MLLAFKVSVCLVACIPGPRWIYMEDQQSTTVVIVVDWVSHSLAVTAQQFAIYPCGISPSIKATCPCLRPAFAPNHWP